MFHRISTLPNVKSVPGPLWLTSGLCAALVCAWAPASPAGGPETGLAAVEAGGIDGPFGPGENAHARDALAAHLEALGPAPLLNFDEVPGEGGLFPGGFFGHTILLLPENITAAALEIGIRASTGGSDPSDDFLALDFDGLSATFGWQSSLSDLEPGGAWVAGQYAVFNLDLAALPGAVPGGIDLLGALADGELDIAVGDDSGVDYVRLSVQIDTSTLRYIVRYSREVATHADVETALGALGASVSFSSEYFERIDVAIDPASVPQIEAIPGVTLVDPIPLVIAPLACDWARLDELRDTIGVQPMQDAPFFLDGSGVNLGILDDGLPCHADFNGRLFAIGTSNGGSHATHVGGIMAADGSNGTGDQSLGIATAAGVYSWYMGGTSANKMKTGFEDYDALAFNNSWGFVGYCAGHGSYAGECKDYDRLIRDEEFTIVFAAGNDRLACAGTFGTVLQNSNAKNIITVGGVCNDKTPYYAGSMGPSDDGRIKPEVVAVARHITKVTNKSGTNCSSNTSYGQAWHGTSYAAPQATGLAGLLIQRHRQLYNGSDPSPALLKALMANTAEDLGTPNPDYEYGFGLIDGDKAQRVLEDGNFLHGAVEQGDVHEYPLWVSGDCVPRVMLCWSDEECSSACNTKALVNDLGLVLISPSGSPVHPWTLNPALPFLPAVRTLNFRDNIEQVTTQWPTEDGQWTIRITGFDVPDGPQEYALVWTDCGDGCLCPQNPSACPPASVASCHVPWDTPFCLNQKQATTHLTICNTTGSPTSFSWYVQGLPAGTSPMGNDCDVDGPTGFSPQNGNTGVLFGNVNLGECVIVPIVIQRPPDLNAAWQVACFQVTVIDDTSGEVVRCEGSVQDFRSVCAVWEDDSHGVLRLSPFVGGSVRYNVTNTSQAPIAFDYEVVPSPDMATGTNRPIVSLDGLPPGVAVAGSVALAPGEETEISVHAIFARNVREVQDIVLRGTFPGIGAVDMVSASVLQGVEPVLPSPELGSSSAASGAAPGPPRAFER